MLKQLLQIIVFIGAIVLGIILRGFFPGQGEAPPNPMTLMGDLPPPAVLATELALRPLDVRDEYIASIEPVQEVDVRTEISGYIEQVHFDEGAFVNEGDLLFTIDPKTYRAQVAIREAELARANAELARSEKFLKRLRDASERSVSQSDLDTAESAHLQAVADLKHAEANLNLATINLGYSTIRAPISGRIGAAQATKGNYMTSASGTLAHIVQVDPIRVVFSLTDRAYLDLRQQELEGHTKGLAAQVRLPNGTELSVVGHKEFDDNRMNPRTGTLAVRYLFENEDNLLVPGGYANILIGEKQRPEGIRLSQAAILIDPEGSYVLTVDEAGRVGTARVALGHNLGTDVVILSGLNAGDRVIVEGVQKVQPGMTATVTLQGAEQ